MGYHKYLVMLSLVLQICGDEILLRVPRSHAARFGGSRSHYISHTPARISTISRPPPRISSHPHSVPSRPLGGPSQSSHHFHPQNGPLRPGSAPPLLPGKGPSPRPRRPLPPPPIGKPLTPEKISGPSNAQSELPQVHKTLPGSQKTPPVGSQKTPLPGSEKTPAPGSEKTPPPGSQKTPNPGQGKELGETSHLPNKGPISKQEAHLALGNARPLPHEEKHPDNSGKPVHIILTPHPPAAGSSKAQPFTKPQGKPNSESIAPKLTSVLAGAAVGSAILSIPRPGVGSPSPRLETFKPSNSVPNLPDQSIRAPSLPPPHPSLVQAGKTIAEVLKVIPLRQTSGVDKTSPKQTRLSDPSPSGSEVKMDSGKGKLTPGLPVKSSNTKPTSGNTKADRNDEPGHSRSSEGDTHTERKHIEQSETNIKSETNSHVPSGDLAKAVANVLKAISTESKDKDRSKQSKLNSKAEEKGESGVEKTENSENHDPDSESSKTQSTANPRNLLSGVAGGGGGSSHSSSPDFPSSGGGGLSDFGGDPGIPTLTPRDPSEIDPELLSSYCELKYDSSVAYYCRVGVDDEELRSCFELEENGTVVVPRCVAPHYYFSGVLRHMTCRDGAWDYVATCEAECGKLTPNGTELSVGSEPAEYGAVPWHAGIYDKGYTPYKNICGGSLVTPNAVISAAHCFWSDVDGRAPASRFAAALGTRYKRWNDQRDDHTRQTSDIKQIHIPTYFQGRSTNFQYDIAVAVLQSPVQYRVFLRPVCLDFDETLDRRQLDVGVVGIIAGWGLISESGKRADILNILSIPNVAINECLDKTPEDFHEYITGDKICAGFWNEGKAVCRGDSGGGFAFTGSDRGVTRHFLRGVASVAPRRDGAACNAHTVALFTQVTRHAGFLQATLTQAYDELAR